MILKYAVGYLAGLACFILLDFLWLGVVARSFYQTQLQGVLEMQLRASVAAVFYLLHIAGLFYFVVSPALVGQAALPAVLVRGALYGFFTYATYDLTSLATVRDWPVALAVVDMAWGSVLNMSVALAGVLTIRFFFK